MKKFLFVIFFICIFILSFATQSKNEKVVSSSLPNNMFVQELYTNSPNNIVLGNPNGKITIVEIYDYNCMYCKLLAASITKLIATNKDIRVVKIPVGALADTSILATKYAVAAHMQGKFDALDNLMMHTRDIDKAKLDRFVKQSGLEINQLNIALASTTLNDIVLDYARIGMFSLLMTNSPGFPITIIGKTLAPHTNQLIIGNNLDKIKLAISALNSGQNFNGFYPAKNKKTSCSM